MMTSKRDEIMAILKQLENYDLAEVNRAIKFWLNHLSYLEKHKKSKKKYKLGRPKLRDAVAQAILE